MTTFFCWSGANTAAKPDFFPTPRVSLPRIHFWVFLPRFVIVKMALLPRSAAFGFTVTPVSVMVTLTVRNAGAFVVSGRAKAGAATASDARDAMATSLRVLMDGDSTAGRTRQQPRLVFRPFG